MYTVVALRDAHGYAGLHRLYDRRIKSTDVDEQSYFLCGAVRKVPGSEL